jgi:hypothetical protein
MPVLGLVPTKTVRTHTIEMRRFNGAGEQGGRFAMARIALCRYHALADQTEPRLEGAVRSSPILRRRDGKRRERLRGLRMSRVRQHERADRRQFHALSAHAKARPTALKTRPATKRSQARAARCLSNAPGWRPPIARVARCVRCAPEPGRRSRASVRRSGRRSSSRPSSAERW